MASSDSSAGKASTGKKPTRYSIYKEYGGMQNFMHSYGLKMWNDDDVQVAKAIADDAIKYKQDAISKGEDASAQASAKSTTVTTKTTTTTPKRKS